MTAKRFRYRAYPAPDQVEPFARQFGCVRVVWNDAITARKAAREAGEKFPTTKALDKALITQAKKTPERAFLAESSTVPMQQTLRDQAKAWDAFFGHVAAGKAGQASSRRVGPPKYKKKSDRQSARYTRNARFKVTRTGDGRNGLLRLPGIPGTLAFVWTRDMPADPSSVTVVKEPDGRWFVSFVVETGDADQTLPDAAWVTGIDLGLESYTAEVRVNPQTGQTMRGKEPNKRRYRKAERALARAQRNVARKQKGSANRNKAKQKAARVHSRIKDQRADDARKLARRIAHDNQVIAIETLSVSGLARSGATGARGRGLRKSVHDAAWAAFLTELACYADLWGRTLIPIGRFEPTSQVCSVCGVKDGPKPLNVRDWTCPACGTHLDRDYNAAVNVMVAAGLAETLNACGPDVRLALARADGVAPSTAGEEAGIFHPQAHAAA